jgi:transposase-like protein
MMNCPTCQSSQIRKNGHHRGKQRYQCKNCDRQFLESYSAKGYSDEVKRQCLKMYVNGMGFRGVERVSGVHHTTLIHWVKQVAIALPDAPESAEIPEIAQVDVLFQV